MGKTKRCLLSPIGDAETKTCAGKALFFRSARDRGLNEGTSACCLWWGWRLNWNIVGGFSV